MNRNPSPYELLMLLKKIDKSLMLASIPAIGNVYHSPAGNFGFSVAIDPVDLQLKASVSQYNCNTFAQKETFLTLDDFMGWFSDQFKGWKEIPVEGRTKGRYELFLESGGQKIDFDDSLLSVEDDEADEEEDLELTERSFALN